MKHTRNPIVLLVLALLLLTVYFGSSQFLIRNQKYSNPTSLSQGAIGYSLFSQLLSAAQEGGATINKRPFLHASALEKFDSIYILSPLTPLSSREADLISDLVAEKGKLLVLAYHNPKSYELLAPLLRRAGIRGTPQVDKEFANGATRRVSNSPPLSLTRAEETYEFYSPVTLGTDSGGLVDCRIEELFCYFREFEHGKGKILLFAGAVPFGNAMIRRADNNRLAMRLAKLSGRALLDEYHHLFSERTVFDLATDPSFVLPLAGFLIGALLYFLFAHTEMHSRMRRRPSGLAPSRGYHDFNRQLLYHMLSPDGALPGAVLKYAEFLQRLLPKETAAIEAAARAAYGSGPDDPRRAAVQLLEIHKKALKIKGRKSK